MTDDVVDEEALVLLKLLASRTKAKEQPPTLPPSISARLAMLHLREQPADAKGQITLCCLFCVSPFTREPRTEEELEQIRRMLLICNNQYRPAVCDNCLGLHMYWMHQSQGPRGEKFHDSPNFLLRHQARFPNGEPK